MLRSFSVRSAARLAVPAVAAAAFLVLSHLGTAAVTPVTPASRCKPVRFEDAAFTVCRVDLRSHELRLYLADREGQPFGSLPNLVRSPEGAGLAMAMNAGMYHHDLMPVGLFVQDGREIARLNQAAGPGNFHLKPNGVFFVAEGRAGILESGAYAKRRPRASLATQSGPMLVIDGQIHPKISDEGPSRKVRNGVGIVDPSAVVFAISDEPVSFGAFARLFRDELGCRNALFLDGSISALYARDLGRSDISLKPLGPIIAARPKGAVAPGR